jgi:hypothetical protein
LATSSRTNSYLPFAATRCRSVRLQSQRRRIAWTGRSGCCAPKWQATLWVLHRAKGTDNHNNGTDNHNNGTDNHNNGTDNHNKGTDNPAPSHRQSTVSYKPESGAVRQHCTSDPAALKITASRRPRMSATNTRTHTDQHAHETKPRMHAPALALALQHKCAGAYI